MSAIVTSLNQSPIMSLENHRTVKEMWDYLQKCHVQDSDALLYTLMHQIHTLEQSDMSIDEYYSAFDRLMGSLISMVPQCTTAKCTTQQFIEKFFTYKFVMGVRSEFESIRSQLLHGSTLTMAHALSYLLTEETRLQSMSTSHMTVPHSVLAAYRKGTASSGTSFDPCVHCKKTNHRSDDCFIKYPEKLASYRARRAIYGHGPSPTSRGFVNVAAVASTVTGGSSQQANSGVSGHPSSPPAFFWPS
jgi:hypothetical protein